MTDSASSLTSWARAIRAALQDEGIDAAALFVAAGLDIAALDDANARYPLNSTTRLWELAVAETGNPAFGLKVARCVRQTTFHALGYSVMASASLLEAFERVVRYFHIVSDAGELSLIDEGDVYRFVMQARDPQCRPANAAFEAMMAVNLHMGRGLAGRAFHPLQVSFEHAQPRDTEVYSRFFHAPVVFCAGANEMRLPAELLRRPLASGNRLLAEHNDEILERFLARSARASTGHRVHAVLADLLSQGEPSQDKVAATLAMSTRKLQRLLREEGTTYTQILDMTRQRLAEAYVADPAYTLAEIAYLLGFSDSSSFSRAFRRWTGSSPAAFRQCEALRSH